MTIQVARQRLRLDDSISSRGFVFLVVGGISTIISTAGADMAHLIWGWPLWLATIPAAQAAIFFKFASHIHVTWGTKDNLWYRFWVHEGVCLIALVAQVLGVFIATNLWHWTTIPALMFGVVAGLGLNFVGNEFLAFKKQPVASLAT